MGVSTAGASPSAAAWVGRRVSERLPEDFGELLDYLASLRPMVQKRVAEENRAAVFGIAGAKDRRSRVSPGRASISASSSGAATVSRGP